MAYRNQLEFLQAAKANGLDRDEAMAALKAYRQESGGFTDMAPVDAGSAPQERPGFGSRALNALGTGLEYIDRYTGSPVRTAIATAQRGLADNGIAPSMQDLKDLGEGVKAGVRQFGRPTSEGASGRDIAENMGATGAGAGALGLAYDIALDPTNFVSGRAVAAPFRALASRTAPVAARAGGAVRNAARAGGEVAEGFVKGGLARASGMTREALETASSDPALFSQARNMARNLPGAEAAAAQQLDAGLRTVSDVGMRGVEGAVGAPRPDLAYQSGRDLLEVSQGASQAVGERFGSTAGQMLEGAAERGLQHRGRLNAAAARVRRIAQDAGIDVSGGAQGVSMAANYGGRPVLDQEATLLQRIAAESVQVENVGQLLELRRGLDARIYATRATPDGAGLFTSATGGSRAADDIRSALNTTIGEHIALRAAETAPRGRGQAAGGVARAMWEQANEIYATSRRALESVDDAIKANVGGDVEKMVAGLKRLSVDDLTQLRTLARQDELMAPVFRQIGDSFVDGLVIQASRGGTIDVAELRKAWDGIGPAREILFDRNRIDQINGAIQRFDQIRESTSLLGTPGALSRVRGQVASGGALRKATGQSVSADPIRQQLAALDDMLNLRGDASLLRQAQALNVAKGIESGVTRLQTGLALGGGIAGYNAGASEGGVAGGLLGALAGTAATSPAGAIAAYRLLARGQGAARSLARHAGNAADLAGRAGSRFGQLVLNRPVRAGVTGLGRAANREEEEQ